MSGKAGFEPQTFFKDCPGLERTWVLLVFSQLQRLRPLGYCILYLIPDLGT